MVKVITVLNGNSGKFSLTNKEGLFVKFIEVKDGINLVDVKSCIQGELLDNIPMTTSTNFWWENGEFKYARVA